MTAMQHVSLGSHYAVHLPAPDDFAVWRERARGLVQCDVPPDRVSWVEPGGTDDLFAAEGPSRSEKRLPVLPADAPLPDGPAGEERLVALPEGIMPFLPGSEDSIGPYLMCSLFSPLPQFADQQSARDTASEVLRLLFEIPAPPAATPAGPDLSRRRLFGLSGA